jgi:hypothetical protein
MDCVCWEIDGDGMNRAHRRGSALWTFFVYSLYQELQCTCLWKHVLGYCCELCETWGITKPELGDVSSHRAFERGQAQICISEVEILAWEMHRHQNSK